MSTGSAAATSIHRAWYGSRASAVVAPASSAPWCRSASRSRSAAPASPPAEADGTPVALPAAMTIETSRPVLLIISDRPNVWVGFRSPDRIVRRWVGERDSDEERAALSNFAGDPAEAETYNWITDGCDVSAMVDLQDT